MDTKKLLEELENVIINASDVPFTNKKMVDGEEATRLIDAINQSLPNELDNAKRIVADKERILLDAEKKADDTIAQAKDYIARITAIYIATTLACIIDRCGTAPSPTRRTC